MAEIDVIILNWNGLKFLREYLPALIRNTPPELADIIIADNGSTDGSVEWLVSEHADRVKTIVFEKNHGFADGYNRALNLSGSKYAVLLNSDVEVTENWLPPMLELFGDPDVAAVMPKIKDLQKRDHFEYAGAAGGFIDRWGFPFCRGRILEKVEVDNGQYDDQREIFWATGACMMIRNDLFKTAGGFDANFFAHMEEIDLCWRFKSLGMKIMFTPSSTVYHLGGGTLPSGNHRKVFLNVRNSLYTLYKNLPRKNMISIVFMRMILDGLAAFRFLFAGQPRSFSAVLKAHLEFYRGKSRYRDLSKNNGNRIHPKKMAGYYPKSIIIDYYSGKKTFSRLRS
jgi:GT2 family glycosyltransferase